MSSDREGEQSVDEGANADLEDKIRQLVDAHGFEACRSSLLRRGGDSSNCDGLDKNDSREALLSDEKLMNRAILDSSFDAIFVADHRMRILQINQASLTEFGYENESELLGQNVSILVGGGHADRHDGYTEAFFRDGRTSRILGSLREVRARRKDGTEFPCQIGIRLVHKGEDGTSVLVGYVRNITAQVEKTRLEIEKKAAEELLINMLPNEVAVRLKADPHHIADHFTRATILFADIVGFTAMSSKMTPIQVVQLLNDLFTRFDECLDRYGLNKVKTIGDCYMVTSVPGCSDPPKTCASVCHFALDMIQQLRAYNEENSCDAALNLRVGINHGPVVAGVVGTKRFLYDIWGDAVNVASRMESTGIPGKIQVTQSIVDSVSPDEFDFEARGLVFVKGIGEMKTFFLTKRDESKASKYWSRLRGSVRDGAYKSPLQVLSGLK